MSAPWDDPPRVELERTFVNVSLSCPRDGCGWTGTGTAEKVGDELRAPMPPCCGVHRATAVQVTEATL